jgi:hypothetical protein
MQDESPLSAVESDHLQQLETVIERGRQAFIEVGSALLEIKDSRLYRATHKTFEDYCRERWGISRSYAHRMIEAAGVAGDLLPIGNKSCPDSKLRSSVEFLGNPATWQKAGIYRPATESQSRPLTKLPKADRAAVWQEAVNTAPDGKVTGAHVEAVVESRINGVPHVSRNSGENEWYTPPKFIECARRAMGSIDLDPASCEVAQANVKAKRFLTIDHDGLSKRWSGTVWLNPPYCKEVCSLFTEKLLKHVASGQVTQACLLVNNATETVWLQSVLRACGAVCFPAGRIRYLNSAGKVAESPLQGQVIVYFGNAADRFQREFEEIGLIFHRRICLENGNGSLGSHRQSNRTHARRGRGAVR